MFVFITFFMAFLTAGFYVLAQVILKHWSDLPFWLAASAALASLGLACLVETEVLRRARFGEVVVLIITFEVAMAFVLSRLAFGEAYGLRDGFGFGLLLLGLGLLLWGDHTGNRAGFDLAPSSSLSPTRPG
ncbi:MAG: hypothetical protein U1D35_02350 [Paracoccaceae bacterium]|nr:hypothetical protein [Paracoccaceae bacterium]